MDTTKLFKEYGYLTYISPEEFYAGCWSPLDVDTDEDFEAWDIVTDRAGHICYTAF